MQTPPKRCQFCGDEIPAKIGDICDNCERAYYRSIEDDLARDAKESEVHAKRDAELRREVFGDPYE
jgi:hypothetical protein